MSLGVLMNVMLTGKVPESKLYDGKFRKIIEECTQTVPNNRYQNVKTNKKSVKINKILKLCCQHRTKQPPKIILIIGG